jgi:hypothetical protein
MTVPNATEEREHGEAGRRSNESTDGISRMPGAAAGYGEVGVIA